MVLAPPRRKRVPVHGVLLLDKPVGISSNDALIKAKRLLNAEKAGHTGTLDPFASGLLPLCFGEATKFSQDLLEADKTYETIVHLGLATSTGDTEGDIVATAAVSCTLPEIEAALQLFRGPIRQIPPMHSALKRDGKPLYEYARAGITLEREARAVTIHQLELLEWHSPFLHLRVTCSKGTYIRVLGEDIGKALGCGGHLRQLRRTGAGRLDLHGAWTLEDFAQLSEQERQQSLAPVDALIATLPVIQLNPALALRFSHGQRLALEGSGTVVPPMSARVRVYASDDGRLLGCAQWHDYGVLAPERLIVGLPGKPTEAGNAAA